MPDLRGVAALIAAGLLIAANPRSAAGEPNNATALIAEAKPAILAVDKAWLPDMRRQDATALAAPYAETGVFVTGAGTVVAGRTAIAQLYRDGFAKGIKTLEGDIMSDGFGADGGLVIEWGHVSLLQQYPDGARRAELGRFVTVWRRNAAGRWEIVRNLAF